MYECICICICMYVCMYKLSSQLRVARFTLSYQGNVYPKLSKAAFD